MTCLEQAGGRARAACLTCALSGSGLSAAAGKRGSRSLLERRRGFPPVGLLGSPAPCLSTVWSHVSRASRWGSLSLGGPAGSDPTAVELRLWPATVFPRRSMTQGRGLHLLYRLPREQCEWSETPVSCAGGPAAAPSCVSRFSTGGWGLRAPATLYLLHDRGARRFISGTGCLVVSGPCRTVLIFQYLNFRQLQEQQRQKELERGERGERVERERLERVERERVERVERERLERERVERERLEQEQLEREREREQREQRERERQDRLERERLERLDRERQEQREQRERQEQLEWERERERRLSAGKKCAPRSAVGGGGS